MGFRRLAFLLSVTFVVSLAACGDNKKPVFDDAGMTDMGMVDASDDAPPDAGCPVAGQTLCGTSCVDVKTDNAHCGDCATDCGTGTCQTNNGHTLCCPSGQTNCDGVCVDTTTNVDNCGTCGTDCGSNFCVTNGTSSICCPTGQVNCGGQCFDTDSDEANCGGCTADGAGVACTGGTDTCCGGICTNVDTSTTDCGVCGTACTGGTPACTPPVVGTGTTDSKCCASGETNCGGTCTSLVTSDANCGGCGIACTGSNHCQTPDTGSTTTTVACCLDTQTNCNGTCSNPLTDNNNCGTCGNQCQGSDTCTSGVCCGPNEINCGGVCVDPDTNPNACGGCTTSGGTACTNPSPLCSDGTCTAGCDISEIQCGNACVTTSSDPNNCGACGTKCAATELCTGGACVPTVTGCGSGKILCGGACVDPMTDENNCGGCPGTTCSSTATCDGGLCCAAGSVNTGGMCCPAGWLNCSGVCKDPLDNATCNSCNTNCGTGTCTTDVMGGTFCCAAGQARCGATCVDLTTDEANCGFCGAGCTGTDTCNPANPTTAGNPLCCDPTTELNCGGGTCANKLTDDNNCGMCGVSCGASGACSNGKCCPNGSTNYIVGANSVCCAAGLTSCDGITCIDLNANGTCGTTCGDIMNCTGMGQVCVNNACTANCGSLANCSGSCADLLTDENHCGICTTVCSAAGSQCTAGVCGCPAGTPTTCAGSCVDTNTNNTHCGACVGSPGADTCDITEQCTAGHCCATGTTWCALANACVDLQSAEANCGACGNVCAAGETCEAGSCECGFNQTSCPSGCKTPGVDPLNCGSCGNVCGAAGNAGKPYCVSNGCVAACPAPLTGCGTGANAKCSNTASDSRNCGACGNICNATQGCSNGQCVNKFPLLADPAKCVNGGPPLIVPTGPGQTTCTGNLGAVSFLFGVCARSNMGPLSQPLFTDAFNSLQGPYKASCTVDADCGTTGKCLGVVGAKTCAGGGVGVNGTVNPVADTVKSFHVGGDFWVFGTFGLSMKGDLTVKQRTFNKAGFSVSGNDRLFGESHIKGPFTVGGSGNLRIDSTLFTAATPCSASAGPAGLQLFGTPKCTPEVFDSTLKEPCGTAADLIPVKSIVEYFRDPAHNDNAAINLPYNALTNPSGSVRLELPCGYYYLDSLGGNQNVTIVVKGRTALFIGGGANINVEMIFDVEPTASLDMFIGGVVRIAHPITLGSPAYPRLTRMYIGSGAVGGAGTSCTSVSQCGSGLCSACPSSPYAACSTTPGTCIGGTGLSQAIDMSQGGFFNGLLWAGYGSFSSSNPVEMYGSIFTNYMDFSGALKVHYDNASATIGDECPPIPPGAACESARDCGGTKACINNTCSACTASSQCIPPQTCNAGVCGL